MGCHVRMLHTLRHACFDDGFRNREPCFHLLVAADDGQLGRRGHLVACEDRNLSDDTRYRRGDGAEAKVHLCTVHSGLSLGDGRLGLTDSSQCLVVIVLGVFVGKTTFCSGYNMVFISLST